MRNLVRTTNRTWNDANRNYVPDCDLRNPVANGECGAWSNLAFGRVGGVTRYTDEPISRLNSQYHNRQGSLTVQQESGPNLGVSPGYFRTWYGGTCGGNASRAEKAACSSRQPARDAADFDPFCIRVPSDSRLRARRQRAVRTLRCPPALSARATPCASGQGLRPERTRVYTASMPR